MLTNAKSSFHYQRIDPTVQHKLNALGIEVDLKTGHLSYLKEYQSLVLNYELVFIRHGETYGNCGQITDDGQIDQNAVKAGLKDHNKRVFQGDCDEEINQLTELGKKQALKAAYYLENALLANHWVPDVIFCSPLTRAKETALPFIKRNFLQNKFFCDSRLKEISFGAWENHRICDFNHKAPCHSFYQNQNALIKAASGTNRSGIEDKSENFCELLLRANHFLHDLNEKYPKKKIIIYSHSMFGAASCILLGKGQMNKDQHYIMFDGKQSDGESCVLPHAIPIPLNFSIIN